jgi:ABC-type transporter Mla subunit MlaD
MWDFGSSKFEKSVLKKLDKILEEVLKMSGQIDALKGQVTALVGNVAQITTVVDSATAAFTELTNQQADLLVKLQEAIDAGGDPAAIQQAADDLSAQNDAVVANIAKLSQAIPANTPAALK